MAIKINEVYELDEDRHLERILHIAPPDDGRIWFIHITDARAWPTWRTLNDFRLLKPKRCDDPWANRVFAASIAQQAVADRWFSLVRRLVENKPDIFQPHERNRLIVQAAEDGLGSTPTLRTHLRRFWQRGMAPDALLADYDKCGTTDKPRVYKKRPGRPPRTGSGAPFLTRDHYSAFETSVNAEYHANLHTTLREAYYYYLCKFEPDNIEFLRGTVPKIKPGAQLPTFAQFKYWYLKTHPLAETARRRGGKRYVAQNVQPRTKGSQADAVGPGARYEIDSTTVDLYIVAEDDTNRIIGRATLYIIVDVATGLVVGMYCGIEPPSYWGVAMALVNAVTDKVAFAAEYGLVIKPEQWPSRDLCSILLGDRGELKAHAIGDIVERLIPKIENAQERRGDAKGLVESMFNTLDLSYGPFLPGYVDTSEYAKRAGGKYRLDAALTLRQLTRILVGAVVKYNNTPKPIKRLLAYPAAVAQGIPPVPSYLWNWAVEHLPGGLIRRDEDSVKLNLLPQATVTATEYGFKFTEGLPSGHALEYDYPSEFLDWAIDAVRHKRTFVVSYDTRLNDHVIVHTAAALGENLTVPLTRRYEAYIGKSLSDTAAIMRKATENKRAQEREALEYALFSTQTRLETAAEESDEQQRAGKSGESDAERIRAIPQNRRKEVSRSRASSAFVKPSSAASRPEPAAPRATDDNSHAYPSTTDAMREALFGPGGKPPPTP